METTDLTTAILRNIRDDIAKLDAKLEAKIDSEIASVRKDLQSCVTRDEFRVTMSLLDGRIDRMHARMVENDLRATTAHQELQATLNQMMAYFGAQGSLEVRIDRCERDIVDLKERVF
jgi:chromosome segregation ATPase